MLANMIEKQKENVLNNTKLKCSLKEHNNLVKSEIFANMKILCVPQMFDKKQPEMLITVTVKYINSILQ